MMNSKRKIVAITMFFSVIMIVITAILLIVPDEFKDANYAILGLKRLKIINIHKAFGGLFIVFITFHLRFNGKVLGIYIKSTANKFVSKETVIGLIIVVAIFTAGFMW